MEAVVRALEEARVPTDFAAKRRLLTKKIIYRVRVPSDRVEEALEAAGHLLPGQGASRGPAAMALQLRWRKWIVLLALAAFGALVLFS